MYNSCSVYHTCIIQIWVYGSCPMGLVFFLVVGLCAVAPSSMGISDIIDMQPRRPDQFRYPPSVVPLHLNCQSTIRFKQHLPKWFDIGKHVVRTNSAIKFALVPQFSPLDHPFQDCF